MTQEQAIKRANLIELLFCLANVPALTDVEDLAVAIEAVANRNGVVFHDEEGLTTRDLFIDFLTTQASGDRKKFYTACALSFDFANIK